MCKILFNWICCYSGVCWSEISQQ